MDLKDKIKAKLKEMDNKITKAAIFDFDGTIVDTPLPDSGRKEYQAKTGKPWPHEGWWSKPESLDMNVFDMPVYDEVINAHAKELSSPDTVVIMLTGRMTKLAQHVEAVLASKGLKFDEYHYNRGGETGEAKMKTISKLLEKYTDVTYIEMWDDRLEHIPRFEAFLGKLVDEGRLTGFKVNVVNGSHH